MPVRVTITIEINEGATTQTLVAVDDMITQYVPEWAAPSVEKSIAENGAKLVRQVACLHGDMRDNNPDAPGLLTGRLRERPLTGRKGEP